MSSRRAREQRQAERDEQLRQHEFDVAVARGRAGERMPWRPFQKAVFDQMDFAGFDECWLNPRYQVLVRYLKVPDGPGMVHLSIKAVDKSPVHDWRDLQRIKNELCGTDCEGIELYPAEDRLIDGANQYHLWVTEPGVRYPVGAVERDTQTAAEAADVGARQRVHDKHHNAKGCKPAGLVNWDAARASERGTLVNENGDTTL